MQWVILFVGVIILLVEKTLSKNLAFMTTPELIKNMRYPMETHRVITTDGYILNHHRIPFGLRGPGEYSREPVLLQHGLVGDSSGWILQNEAQVYSLGYVLAENGYDVWLLNTRGNIYSKGHTKFGPNDSRYYDFSWHEMGIYDLPESIDYILNVTKAKKVSHIGHSQGTTVMYVMLSERPKYNRKVKVHIGYAPVAYHRHTKNPVYRFLSVFERLGILSMRTFRSLELPRNKVITSFLVNACSNWTPTRNICEMMYYAMMGNNPSELNKTQLSIIYGHYPSSSSLKQFTHFVQGVNRNAFAMFDYKSDNTNTYQSVMPPKYNLSNVQVPVYNFYGGRDNFVQMLDVQKLHKELPNLKNATYIEKWAHFDFLYGINAYKYIYKPTLDILSRNM